MFFLFTQNVQLNSNRRLRVALNIHQCFYRLLHIPSGLWNFIMVAIMQNNQKLLYKNVVA